MPRPGRRARRASSSPYNDLRDPELAVPRLLVVVVVPTAIDDWIAVSETELVLRHCGYWRSLSGEAATTNTGTITVEIDRANVFDVEGLTNLMSAVAAGQTP